MNATDIRILLFKNDKGVTPDRIEKAKGLALRSRIEWDAVLQAMTPDERKMVENASQK